MMTVLALQEEEQCLLFHQLCCQKNTVKGGSESHLQRGIQNPTEPRELQVPDMTLRLYFDRANIAPTVKYITWNYRSTGGRDVSSKAKSV